jgi:AcrR family transcriptional regulator
MFDIVRVEPAQTMASASPARPSPLQPDDWIRAAFARLTAQGIETVRVELLARDLGASKGSFYWHFNDREDLLAQMLVRWESDETEWLDASPDADSRAAVRWARFVERSADYERARLEAALRDWARRDARIASRITAIEKKRGAHIASVLRDVGFTPAAADSWAEVALLVYLGWVDRATRDPGFQLAGPALGEFLSDLILAASAPSGRAPR